jgi:hypothetical protein
MDMQTAHVTELPELTPFTDRGIVPSVNAHPNDLVDPWWSDQTLRRGYTEILYRLWPVDHDGEPELFDDLPEGLRLARRGAMLTSRCVEAVIEGGDALALVQVKRRHLWIAVAGRDLASARSLLDAINRAFPEVEVDPTEDDPHVFLRLWGRDDDSRAFRRLDVQPWTTLEGNYAASTRASLEPLMAPDYRPGASGQLLVWYGAPGTGKSFALGALAHAWREWARPHYVADPEALLSEPGYLLELVTHRGPTEDHWRLVVLEDTGELFTSDARNVAGQALSRLLNVTDGMLGQGSKTVFIVTTNEPIQAFHEAVVRPGRCAARVEFEALPVEEAKQWLVARGGAEVARDLAQPATVAELFAMLRGEFAPPPVVRQVGFRAR